MPPCSRGTLPSFFRAEIAMKLSVRRQPLKDHAFSAEKSFDATLDVDHLDDDQRWLSLSFVTNPDGQNVSRFGLAIYPSDVGEVARMMVGVSLGNSATRHRGL